MGLQDLDRENFRKIIEKSSGRRIKQKSWRQF